MIRTFHQFHKIGARQICYYAPTRSFAKKLPDKPQKTKSQNIMYAVPAKSRYIIVPDKLMKALHIYPKMERCSLCESEPARECKYCIDGWVHIGFNENVCPVCNGRGYYYHNKYCGHCHGHVI